MYNKTSVYRVGSLANSQAKIYTTHELNWTNDPIKMLGVVIPISLNLKDIEEFNFIPALNKVRGVLQSWSLRSGTFSGKVLIVNSLIASLFVYKMQIFPNVSNMFLKQIENMIKSFLWNNGKAKIANKILTKDKKQGGLRLVDLTERQNTIRLQWFVYIINNEFWSDVFYSKLFFKIGEKI